MMTDGRYYRPWRRVATRRHRNTNGKPKKSYATLTDAQAACVEMTYATGNPFKAYRCQKCQQFHIGNEYSER